MEQQVIADFNKTTEFWAKEKIPAKTIETKSSNERNMHHPSKIAYEANIKMPAGITFRPNDFADDQLTEIIPGRAWVFPNVLSKAECADWIACGQAVGLKTSKNGLRTSTRTAYYFNSEMSSKVTAKLPNNLINLIENSQPKTTFRGVHDNWKIAKYEKGASFPAHFDQDSFQTLPPNKNGVKVSIMKYQ